MPSTPLIAQSCFKRFDLGYLFFLPGLNVVMVQSLISCLVIMLSLVVQVSNKETLLVPLHSPSSSIPLLRKSIQSPRGILCGPTEAILSASSIIEEVGPTRGLHLNRSKSLFSIPFDLRELPSPLPPDIPSSSEGFILLGAPISPLAFCHSVIQDRIEKIRNSISLLPLMEDSQSEYSLLHSCIGLPNSSVSLEPDPQTPSSLF